MYESMGATGCSQREGGRGEEGEQEGGRQGEIEGGRERRL